MIEFAADLVDIIIQQCHIQYGLLDDIIFINDGVIESLSLMVVLEFHDSMKNGFMRISQLIQRLFSVDSIHQH